MTEKVEIGLNGKQLAISGVDTDSKN